MMTPVKNLKTVVVVLAGGIGVRAGLGMPKQLARIAGKPIMEHTLEAIDGSPDIDEIIVMMEPDHMDVAQQLVDSGRFSKLTATYPGGKTRNDTTQLALAQLGDSELKVLFHDAVRPFIDHRILKDCVEALDSYGAVDTAIPSADTVIQVNDDVIVDVPTRDALRRGQTPQGFLLSVIRQAYDEANKDENFAATDDCTVVLRYQPATEIAVVKGSDENMKITAPIDVFIADKLFQLMSSEPAGSDPEARAQQFVDKTIVIFGGSAGIGASITEAALRFGANVFPYSRSTTNTHVENRADVAEALRDAHEQGGEIDYVINCAGSLELRSLEQFSNDEVERTLDVNLLAPILIAQESIKYLRETRGQLLFFTSSSYTRGRAQYGMYSATKAATVNLTQSLAEEWAEYGVRVNCINPERTKTPMRENAFGAEAEGTLLAPEHVALASLDTLSRNVTGQVIDVRRSGTNGQARA